MSRRGKVLGLLALALLGAAAVIVVWSQRPLVIRQSIVIDASPKEVWDYLGDSDQARNWSVFFHHITPLPGPTDDGKLGALRRCYRRPDESGITWDEEVVLIEPYRHRRIHVFNVRGFGVQSANGTEFNTSQLYEDVGAGKTRLTFAGELDRPQDFIRRFNYWLTHWETLRVFRLNQQNIKAAIEQKQAYVRPHPWEPRNILD